MPTYDYICRDCGYKAEYINVPSDRHPSCFSCNGDNMRRLPPKVRIAEDLVVRRAESEDLFRPTRAIEVSIREIKLSDGLRLPMIKIEPRIIDNGRPSLN